MDTWIDAYKTILPPVGTLGAWVVMGIIVGKLNILDDKGTSVLTRLLVMLMLPLMTFTNVFMQFRPGEKNYVGWYWLPIAALGITAVAYVIGWLTHITLSRRSSPEGRRIAFATMCGWQNAGYITLPIIAALYTAGGPLEQQERMLTYCFLFILGISPTLWSIVPLNMMRASQRTGERIEWKQMVTPPFLANIFAIGLCVLGVPQQFEPETLKKIMTPFKVAGDATVPLIIITLGAMLARNKSQARLGIRFASALIGVKLVVLPAIVLVGLIFATKHWTINPGFVAIILLQSVSPPATALPVIARRYGSPEVSDMVNQAIIWTYLAAVITIPVWLATGEVTLHIFKV
jgi:malate permease and related proteins